MSKRISFVGEGPTDLIVFKAALMSLTGGAEFVVTQIQPPFDQLQCSNDQGQFGGGWKGVLKWCTDNSSHGVAEILTNSSCLVIHLDADVASEAEAEAYDFGRLEAPCPAALDTSLNVEARLRKVLAIEESHPVVFMIPSKATESWVIAAMYAYAPPPEIECLPDPAHWLNGKTPRLVRTKEGKDHKEKRRYNESSVQLIAAWPKVRVTCATADHFMERLQWALGCY
ncbi:MAG: hypothetical protein K8H99_03265 [Nitrospirae bacterium]|nr:hypothetical protein [Fimbriimonadaceae bacterium]